MVQHWNNEDVDKYVENFNRMKKAEQRHINWLIKVGIICGMIIGISLGLLRCGATILAG